MYIPRALETVVRRYSEHFKVVVVTGPRQVGKTTMLKHLADEERARGRERTYLSLDNMAIRAAAKEDPELFLQRYKPPLLIDEIQKAPELLPYIKITVDDSGDNGLFWLTGSQPLHLTKEASETLAGRAGVVEMLGLSNAELAGTSTRPFDPSPDYFVERCAAMPAFDVEEAFQRIFTGSFPEIRALPDDLKAGGFESYIDTYIMRDIRDLANVADELKFRRFIATCAAMTARPVVYSELARNADIDEKTAKSWLSLLVSTYLVKIVQPYSNNLLKRLSKQPIMHFMDTGLAAYLTGWDNAKTLELGAMNSRLFETYVFGEIYRSFANCGLRPPLWFYHDNDRREIDLLLEKNGTLFPIEVKKSANPRQSDAKNFSAINPVAGDVPASLASFKRDIGLGTVVCMTSDTFPIAKGLWAFPAWGI